MPLQPARTVEELRELQELTGDENGAQRVAWTETWERAREWLRGKLAAVPVEEEIDEAGNQWFTLRGASERALLIGGHIDSVPNGGWLDGCLNVMGGVEVLRRLAEDGEPAVTVRLVNWADEEGARFGRSLFGSSAAAGSMADQDELRERRDTDGVALPDALAEHGVDLDRAIEARAQLENAAAYLELHIEQGPVLESLDLPLGVVLGRSAWSATSSPGRARPRTPARRRWTRGATRSPAPRSSRSSCGTSPSGPAAEPYARRAASSASRASSRRSSRRPSSCSTSVTSTRGTLAAMLADARGVLGALRSRGVDRGLVRQDLVDRADPLPPRADRVCRRGDPRGDADLAPAAVRPAARRRRVSRAGVPTVMLFCQSLRGLSHTKLEDTKEEHLELAVQALDRLTTKTIAWL